MLWALGKMRNTRFAARYMVAAITTSVSVAVATISMTCLDDESMRDNYNKKDTNQQQQQQQQQQQLATSMATYDMTHRDNNKTAKSTPPSVRPLQRHSTVQKLQDMAQDMNHLESKYLVNWQEPLGEGAFGAVYQAIDRVSGEGVAVKQINKLYTDTTSFQREMEALMMLKKAGGHPNICGMRASHDSEDYFYIVLDLIAGPEMFEQLIQDGAYSEADAAWHIQEAASALAWMHSLGIVHCDLKPENLMLSSKNDTDAVIKVVDFGCTHLQHTDEGEKGQQQRSVTTNTPAYCPPEILQALRQNPGSATPHIGPSFDAWSLGVILYIMLVGHHPFDPTCDATEEEIERRIISGPKPKLRGVRETEHLSEDAIALMEGLMEYDPEKRLDMEQVLQNRWVAGETASSRKIVGSDKRLAVYRRHKTKIGSAFFKALISQADSVNRAKTSERVSILESAFRRLDTERKGYLRASSLSGGSVDGEDEAFSFSDISSLLSENIKNQYFTKGNIIYDVGQRGDTLYLIDSGTVEFTTSDGFIKMLGSGELVGEELMMHSDTRYSGRARCVTPVRALAISRDLFEKYVSSDEDALLNMAERYRYRRRERASTVLRMNRKYTTSSYAENDTVFREGDRFRGIYLVQEGHVNLSTGGHMVRTLQPGELLGVHAVLFEKPHNATATCISPQGCKVQAMKSRELRRLLRADPSLAADLRELALRRDFKKAVCAHIKRPFPKTEDEILAAFKEIDFDGSGAVGLHELRALVKKFDPSYDEKDIRDMLGSLDLNDSGDLTWKEFYRIFSMDMES